MLELLPLLKCKNAVARQSMDTRDYCLKLLYGESRLYAMQAFLVISLMTITFPVSLTVTFPGTSLMSLAGIEQVSFYKLDS